MYTERWMNTRETIAYTTEYSRRRPRAALHDYYCYYYYYFLVKYKFKFFKYFPWRWREDEAERYRPTRKHKPLKYCKEYSIEKYSQQYVMEYLTFFIFQHFKCFYSGVSSIYATALWIFNNYRGRGGWWIRFVILNEKVICFYEQN